MSICFRAMKMKMTLKIINYASRIVSKMRSWKVYPRHAESFVAIVAHSAVESQGKIVTG